MQHVYSNEAFLGWLKRQPAEKTYHWRSTCNCAMAQYLRAAGLPVLTVGAWSWHDTDGRMHKTLPPAWGNACFSRGKTTFGRAARRLEKEMRRDKVEA